MKQSVGVFVFTIFFLVVLSCKKEEDNPVVPPEPPSPPPLMVSLSGYTTFIDSLYFKMWSDSSSEFFGQTDTINGVPYVTVQNSFGDEYYYSVLGYAGYKPPGEPLILFNAPLGSLPDSVTKGETYLRQTSFFYQGYTYGFVFEDTFNDTTSVALPFGVFQSCLHFTTTATISAAGQSDTETLEYWLAQGPGGVKETNATGFTVIMVRGRVNGEGWGMPFPSKIIGEPLSPQRIGKLITRLTRLGVNSIGFHQGEE